MQELTVAQEIIMEIIPDLHAFKHLSASDYIRHYWSKYKSKPDDYDYEIDDAVLNELIALTLIGQRIMPFYMQAKVAFIPNATYDFIIYCEDIGPITFSAKVYLSEMYKQADIKTVALKNVHRKSESYLISVNEFQVKARKQRLDEVMAINDFIYASSHEYDELLDKISEKQIIEAPRVETVSSSSMITAENFTKRWG